jgi:hypothetical protein
MSVEDIIRASFDKDPTAVATAFNSAIKDKLMSALEARRDQIASSMYGSAEEDVEASDEELDNSDIEDDEDENT